LYLWIIENAKWPSIAIITKEYSKMKSMIMKISLRNWLIKVVTVFITCFLLVSFIQAKTSRDVPPKDGYVPNEMTAIKIAEAIWLPIYGKEIYDFKPFIAKLIKGKIWRVYGTVHTEKGGSPIVEIQKSDGRVLMVIHEK
jgi:hypothetical protein